MHIPKQASPFRQALQASRTPMVAVDAIFWVGAFLLAGLVRSDLAGVSLIDSGFAGLIPVVVIVQIVAGYVIGGYRGRWRVGTFGELGGLAATVAIVTVIASLVNAIAEPQPVPRTVPLIAALFAMVLMPIPRALWRLRSNRKVTNTASGKRVVVLGAGEGSFRMLPFLLSSPDMQPVALLDDDPAKRFRRLHGVPVRGTMTDLPAVARKVKAEQAIIAIPSADLHLVRRLVSLCDQARLDVKVLPPPSELVDGLSLGQVQAITEADMLGRAPSELDIEVVAAYIEGKRVLITGAGGSIGSELSRQVARFNPAELMLLDRDESALHGVLLSITGRARLEDDTTILCDIRDLDAVTQIFETRRPEVVFHAAALKHVPMLERFPDEALKTNVQGTRNVVEASKAVGVERFINISTDKAADPVNVLGLSKRVTERIVSEAARATGRPYVSVRFGNVLGSRGSMLETFRKQVANRGPLTVTDAECTRYFMMVGEAVGLTLQAGALGRPGEVLVLDMGKPVSIDEVARLLAASSPRPIAIEYTGLRPGEKLHEVLLGEGELDERPFHPAITHSLVPALPDSALYELIDAAGTDGSRSAMELMCAFGRTPSTPSTRSHVSSAERPELVTH